MNYLSVENLSKSYGEKLLFQNISFGLEKGERIALIAENGSGKSTLLKIIASKEIQDSGDFTFRGNIRIGYLDQDPQFEPHLKLGELIETAQSRTHQMRIDYDLALKKHEQEQSSQSERLLEAASSLMDLNQAWDVDRRLKVILDSFEISNLEQEVETLSGGQIKRLAFAMVLIDLPDILLLDEPTNHLDIEMIEWLEEFLIQSDTTLLMVTHDRYFLDQVCNTILELDQGDLYRYRGDYAYFLEKKAERESRVGIEIEKARKQLKKEMEWLRRSPKARTTKSKARIQSVYELQDKASKKTGGKDGLKLEVMMNRLGSKILEFRNVFKSFGEIKILQGFDYTFKKGEHIGIIGANGSGKTTLLNLIQGLEKHDSGKIIKGDTIKIGYFSQHGIELDHDKRVIDVLKDIAEVIEMEKGRKITASQLLNHFNFDGKMQHSYVSTLSGGERKRLYLLTVLMQNPNFLILDEPTNDLDLMTLSRLEDFLDNFKGCMLVVSHDRFFLDRLCDHLFIFKGNGDIKDYYGFYTDYKLEQDELKKLERKRKNEKKKTTQNIEITSTEKVKLTYGERLEYKRLEAEIEALENKKSVLLEDVEKFADDYDQLSNVLKDLEELNIQLNKNTDRWLHLAEFDQ